MAGKPRLAFAPVPHCSFRSRPDILRPSSTDPRDASNLLQRAGFTLLTVDVEDITISYPSMWELIEDLRDMGESGAVLGRRPFIKRDILLSAEAIYKGQFVVWGVKSWMLLAIRRGLADAIWNSVELHGHEDGTVPATFQVIYLVSLAYLSLSSFDLGPRRLMKPQPYCIPPRQKSYRSAGNLATRRPRRSLGGRERRT
jgi:hypothetical protein